MKKFIYLLIILCLIGCTNTTDKGKDNLNDETNDNSKNELNDKLNDSLKDNIVTSKEAEEMLLKGAVMIDVRSIMEYEEGHIDGAVSLPLDMINEDTVSDIVPSKDINIIVYCASGNRSASASVTLKNLGYKNVYDLGSMNNWEEY